MIVHKYSDMFYPGVSQLVIEGRSLAKMLPLTVRSFSGQITCELFMYIINIKYKWALVNF